MTSNFRRSKMKKKKRNALRQPSW